MITGRNTIFNDPFAFVRRARRPLRGITAAHGVGTGGAQLKQWTVIYDTSSPARNGMLNLLQTQHYYLSGKAGHEQGFTRSANF